MAELQPGDPWHVGPYEVLARLTADEGAVSAGRLYLARYPGAGQVAVRVIAPRLAADGGVRAGLSDGVAAARAVASPAACPLRAAAILRERAPWVAWEYAPGPSLAAVLAGHGRLPEPAVASLAVGLVEALRAVHDAGAVHGDLRPATVFLAGDRPRVTGYGVAAAVQAAARAVPGAAPAAPGTGRGAPHAGRVPDPRLFIAPELASGEAIGPAGDMFSLGAVVAFAAGGKGPFGIGGPPGSAYHAPYGVPDLGGVPAALRPLITRCLDADPGWRPTAGEFRSLATALLPDAAGPAQWPPVELIDPAPGRARPLPASQVPPASPGAGQKRARAAIIVVCAIAAVIATAIGLGGHASGPQSPGARELYFVNYQAGDCLYGDFPNQAGIFPNHSGVFPNQAGVLPNTIGDVWPDPVWQVPCDQPHTDEVFYVNANFWPADDSYPGDEVIASQGPPQCVRQFWQYVGMLPGGSRYEYTYIEPDAQTWQDGDRGLVCVAYDPTSTLRESIKGSDQ